MDIFQSLVNVYQRVQQRILHDLGYEPTSCRHIKRVKWSTLPFAIPISVIEKWCPSNGPPCALSVFRSNLLALQRAAYMMAILSNCRLSRKRQATEVGIVPPAPKQPIPLTPRLTVDWTQHLSILKIVCKQVPCLTHVLLLICFWTDSSLPLICVLISFALL